MNNKSSNIKKTMNTKYHKYIPSTTNIKKITKINYSFAKFKYEITTQVKVIILVSLIIVLCILFYFLIYRQPLENSQKTFLNKITDGQLAPYDFNTTFAIKYKNNNKGFIPNQMLKLSASNSSFVISFWTIVNEWNKTEWIHLLSFTDPHGCSQQTGTKNISNNCKQFPGFWLSPGTNRLNICLDTTSSTRELVTLDNIPLRKWFNITCVIDNYAIGIYINGRLSNSHVLEARPLVLAETGNIYINESANQHRKHIIEMAYLQVFSKYLNPKRIYELYEYFLPKVNSYNSYLYNNMNINDITPFTETDTVNVKTDQEYIENNDTFEYDPTDD